MGFTSYLLSQKQRYIKWVEAKYVDAADYASDLLTRR